jgi:hypothetical protein
VVHLIDPTLFAYQLISLGFACSLETVEWNNGIHLATFSLGHSPLATIDHWDEKVKRFHLISQMGVSSQLFTDHGKKNG